MQEATCSRLKRQEPVPSGTLFLLGLCEEKPEWSVSRREEVSYWNNYFISQGDHTLQFVGFGGVAMHSLPFTSIYYYDQFMVWGSHRQYSECTPGFALRGSLPVSLGNARPSTLPVVLLL